MRPFRPFGEENAMGYYLNPAHLEDNFMENGPNQGFRREGSAAVAQFS
jgi:hypothetical protein